VIVGAPGEVDNHVDPTLMDGPASLKAG
jgi:hypothetical protein